MPFRNSSIPSRVLDKKQQHWWVFRGKRDCRLCWKSEKRLAARRWNKGNISGIKTEQGWKSTNSPTEGRVSEVFSCLFMYYILSTCFYKGWFRKLIWEEKGEDYYIPSCLLEKSALVNTGFSENILNLCAIKYYNVLFGLKIYKPV